MLQAFKFVSGGIGVAVMFMIVMFILYWVFDSCRDVLLKQNEKKRRKHRKEVSGEIRNAIYWLNVDNNMNKVGLVLGDIADRLDDGYSISGERLRIKTGEIFNKNKNV